MPMSSSVKNAFGEALPRDDDPDATAVFREQFWTLEDLAARPESFEKLAQEAN